MILALDKRKKKKKKILAAFSFLSFLVYNNMKIVAAR